MYMYNVQKDSCNLCSKVQKSKKTQLHFTQPGHNTAETTKPPPWSYHKTKEKKDQSNSASKLVIIALVLYSQTLGSLQW